MQFNEINQRVVCINTRLRWLFNEIWEMFPVNTWCLLWKIWRLWELINESRSDELINSYGLKIFWSKQNVLTGNNSKILFKKQPQESVKSNYELVNFIKLHLYCGNSIKIFINSKNGPFINLQIIIYCTEINIFIECLLRITY